MGCAPPQKTEKLANFGEEKTGNFGRKTPVTPDKTPDRFESAPPIGM